MNRPPFSIEKAQEILDAKLPWTLEDYQRAGQFFRDYGELMIGVIRTAQEAREVVEGALTRTSFSSAALRDALDDLDLALKILEL